MLERISQTLEGRLTASDLEPCSCMVSRPDVRWYFWSVFLHWEAGYAWCHTLTVRQGVAGDPLQNAHCDNDDRPHCGW